jgi:Transposase IS116/IS110/IS902 family
VQQIAGFLGLVSSEQSAGDKQNRGEITRVGDSRLRNKLIQSAWVAIRQDSELREFPFGSQSEVGSINNFGHLAGIAFDNPSGPIHGFIFGGSSFGRFDFPGASITAPNAINDQGEHGGVFFDPFVDTAM